MCGQCSDKNLYQFLFCFTTKKNYSFYYIVCPPLDPDIVHKHALEDLEFDTHKKNNSFKFGDPPIKEAPTDSHFWCLVKCVDYDWIDLVKIENWFGALRMKCHNFGDLITFLVSNHQMKLALRPVLCRRFMDFVFGYKNYFPKIKHRELINLLF